MKCMASCGFMLVCSVILAYPPADAEARTRPPLPKPKPAVIAAPAHDAAETEAVQPEIRPAEPNSEVASSMIVLPRPKPERVRAPDAVPAPKPEAKPTPPQAQEQDDNRPAPEEVFATCRAELGRLGARFTIPEMPAAEEKCMVPNPVRISAIETPAGKVDFPATPVLNCVFAKQFTSWVADVAAPIVKAHTGAGLAAIVTGPGYECRGRNGDTAAKISEHASGNAVDIAAFKLADKESLPVANVVKTGNVESRWLMALRISACGYFTTVLGPGANAAHAEHYHFDLGIHGKSTSYRICE